LGLYFLASLAVFALDRLSKWLVVRYLTLGQSVTVVPHIFLLTYVENSGGAFGILAHHRDQFVLLGLVLLVVMLGASFYLGRSNLFLNLALAFLTGGVMGNLVDRIHTGYVIDFLDFRVWPVFNLADTFICIGAALLAYLLLFSRQGGKDDQAS
jgi:signal peptidase II